VRIKASLFKGLLLALALALIPVVAVSAQKITAGDTCPKVGKIIIQSGTKYFCVKKSGKLVWNKGVKVVVKTPPSVSPTPTPTVTPKPSPTPTPAPSPTSTPTSGIKQTRSSVFYSPPSLPSEDIALCKIKNVGGDGPRSGFPARTSVSTVQGPDSQHRLLCIEGRA